MQKFLTAILVAGVATTVAAADASAQGRHHAKAHSSLNARSFMAQSENFNSIPLTVNRRSWLDSGNSVAKGGASGPAYVSATTAEFAKTQDKIFAPDKFGNAALLGQPYVPGRSVPVVSFSTTPNADVVVDNVYHYQPY